MNPFTADPFQNEAFEPIRFEADQAFVPIEGEWPRDLNGCLYRIGPNPQFAPRGRYNPLQGDGMVHAFRVRDGRIDYRNRWIRTQQWLREREAGRALFASSGNPADSDPSVARLRTDGVANTNLVWHADRLLALEEGHAPIELASETLATLKPWTFHGALRRNLTAHPKVDPMTGELIAIANFPRGRFDGELEYYVFDSGGGLVRSHMIEGPYAGLIHDFAITERFVVVWYCPVTVSLDRLSRGLPVLAFEQELATHVAVVERNAPERIRWFEIDACMVWHGLNAYEEGNRIVLDVCKQSSPMFPRLDGTSPDHCQAGQYLTRWSIDLPSRKIQQTRIWSDVCEYPRVDDRRVGRRHRYGYFACRGGPGTDDLFHRGLARHDFSTGSTSAFHFGENCAVSEPVYVCSPTIADEEAGYLMAIVFDESRNASHLALFAAERVEAGPIARAHLDHRVPMGFHGIWVGGT